MIKLNSGTIPFIALQINFPEKSAGFNDDKLVCKKAAGTAKIIISAAAMVAFISVLTRSFEMFISADDK